MLQAIWPDKQADGPAARLWTRRRPRSTCGRSRASPSASTIPRPMPGWEKLRRCRVFPHEPSRYPSCGLLGIRCGQVKPFVVLRYVLAFLRRRESCRMARHPSDHGLKTAFAIRHEAREIVGA